MSLRFIEDETPEEPKPAVPTPAPAPITPPEPLITRGKIVGCLWVIAILASGWCAYRYYFAFRSEMELVGRAYSATLARSYAAAVDDGAKLLDSGQTVEMAMSQVHSSFESNRTKAFVETVAPHFGKIVPEGTDEAKITPEQRKALAAAWREFAKGLSR